MHAFSFYNLFTIPNPNPREKQKNEAKGLFSLDLLIGKEMRNSWTILW
jgi:hypothetical protein